MLEKWFIANAEKGMGMFAAWAFGELLVGGSILVYLFTRWYNEDKHLGYPLGGLSWFVNNRMHFSHEKKPYSSASDDERKREREFIEKYETVLLVVYYILTACVCYWWVDLIVTNIFMSLIWRWQLRWMIRHNVYGQPHLTRYMCYSIWWPALWVTFCPFIFEVLSIVTYFFGVPPVTGFVLYRFFNFDLKIRTHWSSFL
jgi:hypothetical protein